MSSLAFAMDSSSEEEGDMELEGGGGEGSTVLSSMSKVDQEAMAKADAVKELTERDIANEKRRALFSANPRKRLRKLEAAVEAQKLAKKKNTSIVIQLETMTGEKTGPEIQVDTSTTMRQLEALLKEVLGSTEKQPYAFYNNEMEIMTDLYDFIEANKLSTESLMQVKYQPLSVFRVNPVTRCSHSMPGHMDSILHVSFSPQGDVLASGGGDTTVRFWDIYTATPVHVCRGHKHHVLCTAWSPDGKYFTSGDFKGEVRLWDPKKGEQRGKTIKAHKQWITGIVWQPHHLNAKCELFATSSKDKLARVWNARSGRMVTSMSGHSDSIESIRWGGSGLIYTGSRDRSIKAWRLDSQNRAILVRTLTGHAHRVNTIALNSDYVCRSGAFSHATRDPDETPEQLFKAAQERYATAKKTLGKEILVSGSDDFTMFLWEPETSKKPITRLTGHQQLINHINFSPDGRYFASASFDKKVKVWDGRTGKFIATLNGHVAFVYQVVWSADSRLLCSASKDSTVKVWTMSNLKKAKETLSGHFDEVYALDWSPNGERLASGSKDRMIKIWQN